MPFGTKGDRNGNGQLTNHPLPRAERRHLEAQDKAILPGNGVKAHRASLYNCDQSSHSLPAPVASGRGGSLRSSAHQSLGHCSGINQLWPSRAYLIQVLFRPISALVGASCFPEKSGRALPRSHTPLPARKAPLHTHEKHGFSLDHGGLITCFLQGCVRDSRE